VAATGDAAGGRPAEHGADGVHGPRAALARRLRQGRFELKTLLGGYPRLYLPLARRWGRGEAVGPDTAFVIEGFPRSGNTFATAAIDVASSPKPVLGHHLHSPAQVIAAARRGIPTLVVIRRPEDAVLSLVIQQPHLSLRQALRAYLRFYRPLVPYRDRFVLATFDEVVGDFGAVTTRVNRRFGTSFESFEHTDENVRRALELIEEDNKLRWGAGRDLELKGAVPSSERGRRKEALRAGYRADPLRRPRERAQRLYESFTRSEVGRPLNGTGPGSHRSP
jgi:hypothetical protein